MNLPNKKHCFRTLIQFELGCVYRFPTLELILVFFTLAAFLGPLTPNFMYGLTVSSFTYGADALSLLTAFLNAQGMSSVSGSFYPYINLIPFTATIVIALSLAHSFEDRTIQTFLTYPIKRSSLLAAKVGIATLLLGTLVSMTTICATLLYLPEIYSQMFSLFLFLVSCWLFIFLITAFSPLFSVLSKRLSVTAVGGIGLWYSLQMLSSYGVLPKMLSQISNPLGAAISFVSSENFAGVGLYGDLVYPLLGSFVLTVIVLIFAFVLFERSEI